MIRDKWLRAVDGQALIRHVGPAKATEQGRVDVAPVINVDIIVLILGDKSQKVKGDVHASLTANNPRAIGVGGVLDAIDAAVSKRALDSLDDGERRAAAR